ncbi:uncharacterized protein [Anoplolepis gracilipes]|uniref:uncharacterized protein n=1 Tax=Anoplolepis gracilipes TaxID=354296 RepID=UPI003B9E2DE9
MLRVRQALTSVTADLNRHYLELQEQQQQFLRRQQKELSRQHQQFLQQKQDQFAQLIQVLGARRNEVPVVRAEEVPVPAAGNAGQTTDRIEVNSSPTGSSQGQSRQDGLLPGNMINWLSTQIPEFGGTEDENIVTWIRRVEKVSLIHGATDRVTLLAASSRLVKSARRWYEVQTGAAVESWIGLR